MNVKDYIDTVSMLRESLALGDGKRFKIIADALELAIQENRFETTNGKLPTHRKLAEQLGVTSGTISRAYRELEKLGAVISRVGDGTYVYSKELAAKDNEGFQHGSEDVERYFDMSRNINIPIFANDHMATSLNSLAANPTAINKIYQYAPESGSVRHRRAGAQWLSEGSFKPEWEQIICTNGGQHGLLCVLMGLLKSGDTLATEQLTYPGLISIAKLLGIRLVPVKTDAEGLVPESFSEVCKKHDISALYCMPSIHNPTNAVMSNKRRHKVAAICKTNNLLIIEDQSHIVRCEKDKIPLSVLCPDITIMISSMSKSVSSGLRVGYLHSPVTFISRLANAIRSTCWMATPLAHELASTWILDGTASSMVERQIAEIQRRKKLVSPLLKNIDYCTHPFSSHFWIPVVEPWRAFEIELEMKQKDYLISTAEQFTVGRQSAPQFVRASVSNNINDDQKLISGFSAISETLSS